MHRLMWERRNNEHFFIIIIIIYIIIITFSSGSSILSDKCCFFMCRWGRYTDVIAETSVYRIIPVNMQNLMGSPEVSGLLVEYVVHL